MNIPKDMTAAPPRRLDGFRDYEEFFGYAKSMFDLDSEELEGLYHVLLKLQGIGEDPVETMIVWKQETCRGECPEFIRFLIQVDNLDLESLKEVA
jgi:hypothetical protein